MLHGLQCIISGGEKIFAEHRVPHPVFFFSFRVGITMAFDLLGGKKTKKLQTLVYAGSLYFESRTICSICFSSHSSVFALNADGGQQSVHNLKESDVIPTSLILCCLTPFLLGKTLYSNEMGWESNGV